MNFYKPATYTITWTLQIMHYVNKISFISYIILKIVDKSQIIKATLKEQPKPLLLIAAKNRRKQSE